MQKQGKEPLLHGLILILIGSIVMCITHFNASPLKNPGNQLHQAKFCIVWSNLWYFPEPLPEAAQFIEFWQECWSNPYCLLFTEETSGSTSGPSIGEAKLYGTLIAVKWLTFNLIESVWRNKRIRCSRCSPFKNAMWWSPPSLPDPPSSTHPPDLSESRA